MRAAFPVGRGRSVRMLLVTAAAVALAVGCTSPGGGSGNSASCAYRVTYEDRTYQDVANVDFTIGETLGAVSSAPCDDTQGQNKGAESAAESTAYAVEGLDTDIAIAVGDTPGAAVFFAVDPASSFPPRSGN